MISVQQHYYLIHAECSCIYPSEPTSTQEATQILQGSMHGHIRYVDERTTLGPVPIPRWAYGPLAKMLRHEIHEHYDDDNCGPTNGHWK